jgi:uncharacterized PurR-regulated membrane protein YhhQ (DUF165 family)
VTSSPRIGSASVSAAVGFIACLAAANILTTRFGLVPVGFGLSATAGTFTAGLALGLRDLVQDLLGRAGTLIVIGLGAAVSLLVSAPQIAVASAAAVAVSEVADFAVYTPLRGRAAVGGRRWTLAVTGSNLAGAIVDTAVFITVAFGPAAVPSAMAGQLAGKTWATAGFLLVGWGWRLARLPRHPIHTSHPTGDAPRQAGRADHPAGRQPHR